MLCAQGLDKFYDLRGSEILTPVGPQSLRARDYSWLETLAGEAEQPAQQDKPAHLDLSVQGLSCVACVWLIERVFQSMPGAVRIEIRVARGEIGLEWRSGFAIVDFARRLQGFGYLLGPRDTEVQGEATEMPLARRVGICGAFAMNAMAFTLPAYLGMPASFAFASWFDLVAAFSATLALLVGGSYFAERSWRALRHGILHMDTPIALGIAVAWSGSMIGWATGTAGLKYFDFVAVFIFLMLTGRWLQQSALEKNRRRLLQGAAVPSQMQRRLPDGASETVHVQAVRPGWMLTIRTGEVCPVAARLLETSASLSLEWINGESEAAHRTLGQGIPSGALNIGVNPITIEALESWPDSLLHRLVAGQERTHEATPFGTKLLRGYLITVAIAGVLGGIFWWCKGAGVVQALQVMISVFVVSCPCALGVAAPLADDLATSRMQRLGVFVRSTFLWQRLVRVQKIIFDKTGTLTLEDPTLKNPEALLALSDEQREALHLLVTSNLHPVSRSLFDALGASQGAGALSRSWKVEEVVGHGLRMTDGQNRQWTLGRPTWLKQNNEEPTGDTVFACDGKALASFVFEDSLRPQTVEACRQLREDGYAIYLLSGDRKEKVQRVARALGISSGAWHAGLTPERKKNCVQVLDDHDTLFLGDGANDSLAVEAALCSGSPVTGRNFLEHRADFYFLGSSLRFVPELLAVARTRRRAVSTAFAFASLYNLGAVSLALTKMMSPLLAAVLMPLSSVITLAIVSFVFRRRVGLQWNCMQIPQNEKLASQNGRRAVEVAAV